MLLRFLFVVGAASLLAQAQQSKNFTTLQEAIEDAEHFMLSFNGSFNFPSLAVGLSVRGKPVLRKAWGLADLENYVPAKVSTHYRIASISKTITSVIIGGLVDKGLIHYDDSIYKYLNVSQFPQKKWENQSVPITIRQLLSHTGGTHVTELPKDIDQVVTVQNVMQTLERFKDEPLHFKPGTRFSYSNYGFQLLGAVVEAILKKPFQQVMADFFLNHNLTQSYARNMSVVVHDIARYYVSLDEKQPKHNMPTAPYDDLIFVEGVWPAGGVVTTVDDLLHYGQLLIDSYKARPNAIISSKTLKEMWSPQTVNLTTPFTLKSDYGLGWIVAQPNAKLKHQHLVWHSGGLIGATTFLVIYPDEEIVGVAFTNKGGIAVLPEMILHAVDNIYPLVK